MKEHALARLLLFTACLVASRRSNAFNSSPKIVHRPSARSTTRLNEMKRPLLDRLATFVFKLENDRVANSSVEDERGRMGEPMEWADDTSFANQFSNIVSSNSIGYKFKQTVADLVAGDYDR